MLHGGLFDQLDLVFGVGREHVDGHHHRNAELLDVFDVGDQVGQAGPQQRQVLVGVGLVERAARHNLGSATMRLQRSDGCHQHRSIGLEAGDAALDVEEFLRAHVGAETRIR